MTHPAALPHDEARRLARLRALAVLDTEHEALFDSLVRVAADVCGVPISLVSLVDTERQWFKAGVGLPGATETPREMAFCSHTILGDDVMEVPDATADWRFVDNPLVTGQPGIRFYAGAPLCMSDGSRIGTLCVIDRVPKKLDERQLGVLRHLASAVVQGLEFRERALHAVETLLHSEARQAQVYASTPAMLHSIDAAGLLVAVSDHWLDELGYRREEVLGRRSSDFLTAASRERASGVLPEFFRTGRCDKVEYQMVRKDGQVIDVELSAILERDAEGRPSRSMAVIKTITARKRAERAMAEQAKLTQAVLDNVLEGIITIDTSGSIRTFNPEAVNIFGYSAEEVIGKNVKMLMPADDADRHDDHLGKHRVTGVSKVIGKGRELNGRRKDGSLFPMELAVSRCDQLGKPMFIGVMRDISLRKQHENEMRETRNFLERTGSIAGIGGWELDIESRLILWSEQTCALHEAPPGHSPSLVEAIDFYAPEARPVVRKAVENAIAFGTPFDVELPVVSWKGRAFWARAVGSVEYEDGKPVRLVGAFQDVTARKEMERKLAESHQLLQVTLDSIGDAVITTDIQGRIQWLNPVAERMTGWAKSEARGRLLTQVFVIVNEETRKPTEDPVARCIAHGKVAGLARHTILISRDGHEYGIEDSAAPIRSPDGELHGAVLVFHDVSEQRRLSNEMSHRATHDALTGLTNRMEFENRLERLLERARIEHSSSALMYIDLDQFKLVNDACGHSIGDQLLRQVSTLLQGCVRGRDTVARLGGDEFGILLEHCDIEQARRIANKICEQMEEFRFLHDGRRFRIGTSIGLVPMDERWANMALVMQAADTSCYAAKEAGRNRVHTWFDTDRAIKTRHGEMQWVTRLEQALDEDRFELFGQRIVPIGSPSARLHLEVLLRLREADGTIVPPGVFLPAAERFHLATRIDRWVVRNTFEWLESIGDAVNGIELISINLSGQSIGDRAFHQTLIEGIGQAGFDVGVLCFEITETAAITNMGDAQLFIEEVRRLGAKIALDDFGAGASSFGYLKNLPVDFLKIDGQFITDLLNDALDNAAVRCFRDVARVVGVKTIAEFVEHEEVLDALREIGIDMAQGYLIHRPEPIGNVTRQVCLAD
jgi:diguanylate cyclase (GGDEF)-like protein/PAS domain S-box-containing protein